MTTQPTHVVVGYDFTKSAEAALDRSIALAMQSPDHVIHVACILGPDTPNPAVPHRGRVTWQYAELVQRELANVMARKLRAVDIASSVAFYVHVRIGQATDELLDLARDVGAELVIVGCKTRGAIERVLLGSVAEEVVRRAACTVEVARGSRYPQVDLQNVYEVPSEQHYVAPHRYRYDQTCATLRPDEWPLY